VKENTFGVPSNLSLNIRTYGETYRPLTEKYKPSRRNTVRYLPTRFLHHFGEIPQTTYLRVSYTISEKYRKLPTYVFPTPFRRNTANYLPTCSLHHFIARRNIRPTRILHHPYGYSSHNFPYRFKILQLEPINKQTKLARTTSSLCVPNTADSTVPPP
jgi:hypothetical protein